MKKNFLDTDVIIDFLTNREPFAIDTVTIFEYAYRKKVEVNVSIF